MDDVFIMHQLDEAAELLAKEMETDYELRRMILTEVTGGTQSIPLGLSRKEICRLFLTRIDVIIEE
jgi:predicted nucleotide-binding protein